MAVVEAMAAALEERLQGVRPNLSIRDTVGDGHCQYRGVAMQCPRFGNDAHGRLRSKAITYVEDHAEDFSSFFAGTRQADEHASCIKLARRGVWGDNVSLMAMSHVVKRPIAVWRFGTVQKPNVFVYPAYDAANPTEPIYLELDESRRGKEHYSALSLGRTNRKRKDARNNAKKTADKDLQKKHNATKNAKHNGDKDFNKNRNAESNPKHNPKNNPKNNADKNANKERNAKNNPKNNPKNNADKDANKERNAKNNLKNNAGKERKRTERAEHITDLIADLHMDSGYMVSRNSRKLRKIAESGQPGIVLDSLVSSIQTDIETYCNVSGTNKCIMASSFANAMSHKPSSRGTGSGSRGAGSC